MVPSIELLPQLHLQMIPQNALSFLLSGSDLSHLRTSVTENDGTWRICPEDQTATHAKYTVPPQL